MKKLFLKLTIICSPIIFLLVVYFYRDPSKVLYHYSNYYLDTPHIFVQEEVVSAGTFTENYKKYNYDSYIFGGCQSVYWRVGEWENYINSNKCFHFDAFSETLIGMLQKMEYVKKKGMYIKNAVLILDHNILSGLDNPQWSTFSKSPETTGESWAAFQIPFLEQFFYSDFLKGYMYYFFTKKAFHPSAVFFDFSFKYDNISNEYDFDWEQKLNHNIDSFYRSKANVFWKRDSVQHFFPRIIGDRHKILLSKIKEILDGDHTDYRIVINPLYDQLKLDSTDLKCLYAIFGEKNVFDFSGKNKITKDIHNYYDVLHYRPSVADTILKIIYAEKNKRVMQ